MANDITSWEKRWTEIPDLSVQDWLNRWDEVKAQSPAARTQKDSPEAWKRFYDQVGHFYDQVWGGGRTWGPELARILCQMGWAGSGMTALDLGAGAGPLSIPLARKGCRVWALDYSEQMLKALGQGAGSECDIHLLCQPLDAPIESAPFDLVVAAFFPPVLSRVGVARMEALSRKGCAVSLAQGSSAITNALWQGVMKQSPPGAGVDHLRCLHGYLSALGRAPQCRTIEITTLRPVAFDAAREFFKAYFRIYGKDSSRDEKQIKDTLFQMVSHDSPTPVIQEQHHQKIGVILWSPEKVSPPQ